MPTSRSICLIVLSVVGLGLGAGCAVPQPRGEGMYQYVTEPTTNAGYHLYLPVDYVKHNGRHPNPRVKRWPLVMTFHGMKPWDNAKPQEREWEKEADNYGYIICAPELKTSDSFMEYPLTDEHWYVLDDKKRVMAIMDHVFATTLADPDRVLATSWSCGGYLAHYFVNRYPERFSCLAPRLSNFSRALLKETTVPRYRDKIAVAVFIGDGDLPACKYESEEAVAWYMARKFRVVRGKMIDDMGHKRIPQTAAAFFAEHCRIQPLHPVEAAQSLGQIQMTEYQPTREMIAQMAPPRGAIGEDTTRLASREGSGDERSDAKPEPPPRITKPPSAKAPVKFVSRAAGKNYPFNGVPVYALAVSEKPSTPSAKTGDSVAGSQRRDILLGDAGGSGDSVAKRAAAPREEVRVAQAEPPRRYGPTPSPDRERQVLNQSRRSDTPVGRQNDAPKRTPARRITSDTSRNSGPGVAPLAANAQPKREASRPAGVTQRRGARVRPVKIRLNGPSIGTTPHYLAYSVDLPPAMAEGADFLWMDNGLWIGDEPRGVKILESPGLHRISVLIITKDNVEYRGSETVQVLERGPTAGALAAE